MQHIIQILIAIALIAVILLQAKGTGLGSAWGGSGTYHSKRGVEKSLFTLTVFLAVIFVLLSAFISLA